MSMLESVFAIALLAKLLAELALEALNRRHVARHRAMPEALAGAMDAETFGRAQDYTLAKSRFRAVELAWEAAILAAVVLGGALPWLFERWTGWLGDAGWSSALFLVAVTTLLSIPALPLEYWAQFRLEARFGFNRSSPGLWFADKLKGAAVGVAIGFPLLWLLISLVDWLGEWWWVYGFAVFFGFQLIMLALYPMLILPLFNKLEPLPEGAFKDRLMALADRAGFKARTIQVMDGSKRSSHSNAFFTGFGRFRRIVLYDTLIEQLSEEEIEAVLAHEIGHYKKGHIPKTVAIMAAMTLGGFWLVSYLASSPRFFADFGFAEPNLGIAFLLFSILGGLIMFWVGPAFNALSRKHEYEADAFARDAVGAWQPLSGALRRLSEKNLSNLTPHPLYSGFHYSHPTLLERERALRA